MCSIMEDKRKEIVVTVNEMLRALNKPVPLINLQNICHVFDFGVGKVSFGKCKKFSGKVE